MVVEYRVVDSIVQNFENKVVVLREKIDEIDHVLLSLLSKRFNYVEEVGKLKKEFNEPMMQPARVQDILSKRENSAQELGLPLSFGIELFKLILEFTCNHQDTFIKNLRGVDNEC